MSSESSETRRSWGGYTQGESTLYSPHDDQFEVAQHEDGDNVVVVDETVVGETMQYHNGSQSNRQEGRRIPTHESTRTRPRSSHPRPSNLRIHQSEAHLQSTPSAQRIPPTGYAINSTTNCNFHAMATPMMMPTTSMAAGAATAPTPGLVPLDLVPHLPYSPNAGQAYHQTHQPGLYAPIYPSSSYQYASPPRTAAATTSVAQFAYQHAPTPPTPRQHAYHPPNVSSTHHSGWGYAQHGYHGPSQ